MTTPRPGPPRQQPDVQQPRPPRRDKPIPNGPEDIEHREEAERVRKGLALYGVFPTSPGVYPTVDRKGYVRLTFEEVWHLISLITADD